MYVHKAISKPRENVREERRRTREWKRAFGSVEERRSWRENEELLRSGYHVVGLMYPSEGKPDRELEIDGTIVSSE